MGYWNNKDRVIEAAKQCTTKMEFKRRFGGAFNAAIRYGWEDEVFSGFTKTIKYADLDAKIHCVYVYEMTELKTCYVGRTSDLHKRDLSHRRGRKHKDGSVTYDSLYAFCVGNNTQIPEPIVKDKELSGEESLIREDYWVNSYKENGWNVINKAKTGRLSGSLGAIKKWDYETCKEFCKNYAYKSEVRAANCTCYTTCLKNNWFEEFGIADKKVHPNGCWNIKDNCIKEAKKYNSRTEFIIKSIGAYRGAKRNGWLKDVLNIVDNNSIMEKGC